MNADSFVFNGDWSFPINLPGLAGFQERNGTYTSLSSAEPNPGLITIEFEDDLSENTDPYPEQLRCLQYILGHQEEIAAAIISRTMAELPEIIVNYGLEEEAEFQDIHPVNVKSMIGFSSICIKIISKEGLSYFDLSGGCNWDEEHGLNLLFHQSQIISFGGIDGNSTYEAKKDGGMILHQYQPGAPRRYLPDPKYQKLKPSQQFANETYEIDLISQQYNSEFIQGVENGDIDINGRWVSQDKTFLEAACWYRNNTLVSFLLQKKAAIRFALFECVGYGDNPEAIDLLLEQGADINTSYANGNTVIFELVNSLAGIYRTNDYYREINRPELIAEVNIRKIETLKASIRNLIQKGADPLIRNKSGQHCFDLLQINGEESRREIKNFLLACMQNSRTELKGKKPWWKIWK